MCIDWVLWSAHTGSQYICLYCRAVSVSNGSANLDGSRGSWVSTCDPLTHDRAVWLPIGSQYSCLHCRAVSGSNGSAHLDGSRGSWVSTCDPLTHDPLIDDEVSYISRTVSVTSVIRHVTSYCHKFRDIDTSKSSFQLCVAACRLLVQHVCRRQAMIVSRGSRGSWISSVIGQMGHWSHHTVSSGLYCLSVEYR